AAATPGCCTGCRACVLDACYAQKSLADCSRGHRMIRSILYATDLGLYAPYLLQHSLLLAQAHNADLYVVHAVEPLGLFAESVLQTYLDEKTLDEMRRNGLNAVMASIEERVLEGFREQMDDAVAALESIRAVRVIK